MYKWLVVLQLIYMDGTPEVMDKEVASMEECLKMVAQLLTADPKEMGLKNIGAGCIKIDPTTGS